MLKMRSDLLKGRIVGSTETKGLAARTPLRVQQFAQVGKPDGAYKSCGKPTGTAPPQRNCFTARQLSYHVAEGRKEYASITKIKVT